MIQLSKDQARDIKNLTKYPEYGVFARILEFYVQDMNRLDAIKPNDKISVEAQVSGRLAAMEALKGFLREIGALALEKSPERRDTSE